MDKIEISEMVNGKKIGCEFIFDRYTKQGYHDDFYVFKHYQQGKEITQPSDVENKFLKLEKYPMISYETFRTVLSQLFSKSIFQMIKNCPYLLEIDTFTIQLKLLDEKKTKGYFEYIEEASTPEIACFTAPGSWFLHRLVAPYSYSGDRHWFDYQSIERFFSERVLLHFGYINKEFRFIHEFEQKFKDLAGKKRTYALRYLYASLFYMKEDGLKQFIVKSNDNGRFDISIIHIREYNANMTHLSQLVSQRARKLYIDTLGEGNTTLSGETMIGRMICTTIALWIAKQNKDRYSITIGSQILPETQILNLNQLFSSRYPDKITIGGFSKKTITETIARVKPTSHYFFLKLYEEACNGLDISEENRIMTSRRFYTISESAKQHSKEFYQKKMKDLGFDSNALA